MTEDKLFYLSLLPFAATIIAVFILFISMLAIRSAPIFIHEGLAVYSSSIWRPVESNPGAEQYGLLAPIIGTFIVSLIAIIVSLPPGLSLAIMIKEYLPSRLKNLMETIVEVMAGLPTVLYGMWASLLFADILREKIMVPIHGFLWFIPFFGCQPESPYTVFTAGVVLGIMIIPYMVGLILDGLKQVPGKIWMACYSLGLTRYETIKVIMNYMKPVIIASLLLSLGRAAGETIAVSLTIGNTYNIPACLFEPGYTVSSLIADQFGNSVFYKYMASALYAGGLFLLLTGMAFSSIGLYLMRRWRINA